MFYFLGKQIISENGKIKQKKSMTVKSNKDGSLSGMTQDNHDVQYFTIPKEDIKNLINYSTTSMLNDNSSLYKLKDLEKKRKSRTKKKTRKSSKKTTRHSKKSSKKHSKTRKRHSKQRKSM